MSVNFFEDGFDYRKYIDERMLEVQDIEERHQLRNIMAEMLIPFYEHVDASYKQIEDRMLHEKSEFERVFQVITGIQERSKIDVSDAGMFPMRIEDLEAQELNLTDLMEAMKQGWDYKICSVFLQADYKKIKELEKSRRIFRAVIKTESGEYPASVRLTKNREYLDMVEGLYQEFVNNSIEWRTLCTPYLHKIYDIRMIGAECPEDESIEEIFVFFEDFEPYVKYNYVPIWNIRNIKLKTNSYPSFCLDRIHYEHCIAGVKLKDNHDYLVAGTRQLWSVSRRDDDLFIQCDEKLPTEWILREFCYEQNLRSYELPLMKNTPNVSVRNIRTIAGAKRYVMEMGCGDYIELMDIKRNAHETEEETYNCNEFMMDEIRKDTNGPVLYFEFRACDTDSILTRDIMSYVVSQLQLIYPEYHCKGILI